MTNHSTTSKNPFDIFIVGLRKGLDIGLYSLLPNVLMAFVLTYMLNLFGVMKFLGDTCGGVMGAFDLPGEAITVLLATWLSCGAGVGVAASLAAAGQLNAHDVTIRAGLHSDGLPDPVHGPSSRRGQLPEEVLAAAHVQQRLHGLPWHDRDALRRLTASLSNHNPKADGFSRRLSRFPVLQNFGNADKSL